MFIIDNSVLIRILVILLTIIILLFILSISVLKRHEESCLILSGIITLLLVSVCVLYGIGKTSALDVGFVSGLSKNYYLEGAKLIYDTKSDSYKELQPNGIIRVIDRIELNNKQNDILVNDDSDIILLGNCVYDFDCVFLKFRYFYNILYLDADTYEEYLNKNVEIDLDDWMTSENLLDENGNVK